MLNENGGVQIKNLIFTFETQMFRKLNMIKWFFPPKGGVFDKCREFSTIHGVFCKTKPISRQSTGCLTAKTEHIRQSTGSLTGNIVEKMKNKPNFRKVKS